MEFCRIQYPCQKSAMNVFQKQEQKENNKKNKLEFQPPKVKVDPKLKRIREKRILMSNKDSVTTTEANNKKRFMKNLDFMANIQHTIL